MNTIWENLKQEIKDTFSKPIYDLVITNAKPLSFENNILTISVKEDTEQTLWEETILRVINQEYSVVIVLESALKPEQAPISKTNNQSSKLNQNYTFDNFVVGDGNIMTHAAALAVSDTPGKIYNPLFIYGGPGLGKTHLMHAIGNAILNNKPDAIVRYVTSEAFTNEFTTAIRKGEMEQFTDKYRRVDLLLVDDIQFLAGKKQTLDEFFNTFNTLYDSQKQIVLTSDRLATEIPELPDRLVSRFSSGLLSDIKSPELETRAAILRKKADSLKIDITDETISYIAEQVKTNVRELEGALNRVNFYSVTKRSPITTGLAAEALNYITPSENKLPTIHDIQQEVSKVFNVSVEQMCGKKRSKEIVVPRQVAMFLSRELTQSSLTKIGVEFGGKDHTTIMHACEKIQQKIDENYDLDLIRQIEFIRNKF